MNKKIKIEASMACANFKNLEKEILLLEKADVDFLHIDIMDGSFVPNFALDFSIMETLKEMTSIPLECHLMIENPERYLEKIAGIGVDYISVHYESSKHIHKLINSIKELGIKAGIAFNPATPISGASYILEDIDMITIMTVNPGFSGQNLVKPMIRKIRETKQFILERGYSHIDIQVDGNVSFENIPEMLDAGATMLVGGSSSIFHKEMDIIKATEKVRGMLKNNEKNQAELKLRSGNNNICTVLI